MRVPVHLFDDRNYTELSKKEALKVIKKLKQAIKSGEIEVTHMRHDSGRLVESFNNGYGMMQAVPATGFRSEIAFRFNETPKG